MAIDHGSIIEYTAPGVTCREAYVNYAELAMISVGACWLAQPPIELSRIEIAARTERVMTVPEI